MPEDKIDYEVTAGQSAHMDDHDFFNLPSELVDDWRWDRVRMLGLFWMDRQLVEKQAAFVAAQHELDDSVRFVVECQRRLESREGRVRSGIDEAEIFGEQRTNKDEREQKRKDIVNADQDYQSRLQAYNEAVADRNRAEIIRDLADQEVKNVRMRLNWRIHVLDYLTSMRPIRLDRIPNEDGTIPALENKPEPKADIPMSQQTAEWLAAMANSNVRYGMVGQLALQVLPEGVDPDHPRVQAVLEDIRKHKEPKL